MADNERQGQGHLQPDKHRYHLKGDAAKTPEGWGGAHMGIPERISMLQKVHILFVYLLLNPLIGYTFLWAY